MQEQKEDMATFRKAKKLDDDGESLKAAEVAAVRRMQKQFSGHILRRTTDSVDWRGENLLQLPPHKEIVGVLELTERETEIIQKRAEDARNRQVSNQNTLENPSHLLLSVVTANESGRFFQTRVWLRDSSTPFLKLKTIAEVLSRIPQRSVLRESKRR